MMPACQAGTVFAHGCWKYTWLFANTNYQGDSFMSNVIKFLEKLGQDAQLRGASQEELAEALAKAQVDAPYCSAILAKDTSQLQDLLGLRPMFYVQMPVEEPQEEEEDEDNEEEPESVRTSGSERLIVAAST